MGIDSHLSTCVGTQSPKYLEMAQRHISLSTARPRDRTVRKDLFCAQHSLRCTISCHFRQGLSQTYKILNTNNYFII
jgi:hypothetical protein